jgi:hypothetical protein
LLDPTPDTAFVAIPGTPSAQVVQIPPSEDKPPVAYLLDPTLYLSKA